MNSLYLLIPLSVLLVFVIGLLFWWSVRSGQFDDLEGPAYRLMMDDDRPPSETKASDSKADTPAEPDSRDGD
ncbi:MAG TPA: cbb3-type cytochrome oxidase assembly protein CcoS [Denitromonas sp.]|uniref:cbb3-type cytochrome oxidase assembly protein CcoS n=1 Tax=Denitromonas sp. TaxID=2734609 RepID=UPI001D701CC6|nr:cbb3-type cytochrome oxidase assembly protein CcoS [Rhodocyclaceae bacterium]MCP5221514.1 cbb3-type cytochrome oxidase assembly protein CcoS [Zoogloeaceae bacterium]HQU87700.1 cbb3-type cytochrome oxidase assembly protein CcoS [Denitromonas sp.]HQV14197.1 cbb3-type cytochrome oxidase assembly protein CcoS [Denitromonas sp.]